MEFLSRTSTKVRNLAGRAEEALLVRCQEAEDMDWAIWVVPPLIPLLLMANRSLLIDAHTQSVAKE